MSQPESPLLPHGGYRKLRSYVIAEAVYDATVVLCRRFFAHDRRMTDQLVQAARSGVRNISEGSGAAATSRASAIKLTNVARASLGDELLCDYESFLRQNGLRVWHKESPEALAMRERLRQDHVAQLPPAPAGAVRLTGLAGLADFVGKADAELAGNAMLCAINQAVYLLNRQLKRQSEMFVEEGGFTERLHAARSSRRAEQIGASAPGKPAPACPRCGKPMVPRTARKGSQAGQAFWGCSTYPDCVGTRRMEKIEETNLADLSDRSDRSGSVEERNQ
jgi:four helix bundle suffix protein